MSKEKQISKKFNNNSIYNDCLFDQNNPILDICYDLNTLHKEFKSVTSLGLNFFEFIASIDNTDPTQSLNNKVIFHLYANKIPMIIQTFGRTITSKEIDEIIRSAIINNRIKVKNGVLKIKTYG